jgi:hypothetical protein
MLDGTRFSQLILIRQQTMSNNVWTLLIHVRGCLAKPLGIPGGGSTHEVSLMDRHHRLRSLRIVEAYRSAVEATLLLVLNQSGCFA